MATHSSILAWRIPWTEEPGRLQSIVSQREGHPFEKLPECKDYSHHTNLEESVLKIEANDET